MMIELKESRSAAHSTVVVVVMVIAIVIQLLNCSIRRGAGKVDADDRCEYEKSEVHHHSRLGNTVSGEKNNNQ